jgi:hypothetical protein
MIRETLVNARALRKIRATVTLQSIHFFDGPDEEEDHCGQPELDWVSHSPKILAWACAEEFGQRHLQDFEEKIVHRDRVDDQASNQVEDDHYEGELAPFL